MFPSPRLPTGLPWVVASLIRSTPAGVAAYAANATRPALGCEQKPYRFTTYRGEEGLAMYRSLLCQVGRDTEHLAEQVGDRGYGRFSLMANPAAADMPSILSKLGVGSVTNDLEGLRAFYRAWCLGVPFDDLQKTLALFENGGPPLPPLDARQFFADWLESGTGATCWQHSDALCMLLRSAGFDARRAVGTMWDLGESSHGTVLVHLADGSTWLVDNAFLTMEPLRIDPGRLSHFDGTYYAEVELEGDQIFVHGYHPPMTGIFFRLLDRDVPEEFYAERWSTTYGGGPFVRALHIRRNSADRFHVVRGNQLHTCAGRDVVIESLDPDGVIRHLTETFGIAPDFVTRWAASGALESSMQPPGARPDLPLRTPPSKRTKADAAPALRAPL